jgi:hypothetical protein
MSGTPRMVASLVNRIAGDSAIVAQLPGGIYDRPIKYGELDSQGRIVPPGATPDAFDADGRPRPAATVTDATDEAAAFGPDGSFLSFPWIYIYAAPTTNGKNTIANVCDLLYSRLNGWVFPTGNGTGCDVKAISRLAVLDDPDDARRVLGGMRLQVSGLWRRTG